MTELLFIYSIIATAGLINLYADVKAEKMKRKDAYKENQWLYGFIEAEGCTNEYRKFKKVMESGAR